MKQSAQLQITENVLMLQRGRGELLVTDYLRLRPLYIKQGRDYVAHFLKAASQLGSYERIIDAFPRETALLDMLMDHGVIVPHATSQADRRPESLVREACIDNRRSISLFLLMSQSCNMGCVYCLNGRNTYQTERHLRMDRDVAFRSVERSLESLGAQGSLEIIFFGGEPLLNWPLAKGVITHCEHSLKAKHPDKELKYHLTTNLSVMPDDLIAWAKRYNITFLCDVDGPEPIHNRCRPFKDGRPSHEIITGNIRRLAEAGLKVDLRATITALNQDHLLDIAEHHKAIGGKSSAFVPVNPITSDEEILPQRFLPSPLKIMRGLTEVYQRKVWNEGALYPFNQYAPRLAPGAGTTFGCGAPCGNTLVVDVNGDAYPCIYLVGIRQFHLGNIMNRTYPNGGLLQSMCDRLHVDRMEECRSCVWRYVCGGGCPLRRLMPFDKGAPAQRVADYWKRVNCDCTKHVIELALWDRAEAAAMSLLRSNEMRETSAIAHAVHC
jgi:uncharacterized protein